MSGGAGVLTLAKRLWNNRSLLEPVLDAIEAVVDTAKITIEVRRRISNGVEYHDIVSVDAQETIDEGLDLIDDFEKQRGKR